MQSQPYNANQTKIQRKKYQHQQHYQQTRKTTPYKHNYSTFQSLLSRRLSYSSAISLFSSLSSTPSIWSIHQRCACVRFRDFHAHSFGSVALWSVFGEHKAHSYDKLGFCCVINANGKRREPVKGFAIYVQFERHSQTTTIVFIRVRLCAYWNEALEREGEKYSKYFIRNVKWFRSTLFYARERFMLSKKKIRFILEFVELLLAFFLEYCNLDFDDK